jgi:hypothetical protein
LGVQSIAGDRLGPIITVLVKHGASARGKDEHVNRKAVGNSTNVLESPPLLQCGLARSHALKQATWGPCFTRTVM